MTTLPKPPGKDENLDPFILSKLDEINKSINNSIKVSSADNGPTRQLQAITALLEKIEKRTRTIHIICVTALCIVFGIPLAALLIAGIFALLAILGYAIAPPR